MNYNFTDAQKLLKENFYLFFCHYWSKICSDKFIESKHIKYIADELQHIGEKIIKREKPEYDWYIFNVPPGSTKSSLCSIMWPTWLLINDPSLFVINTSYSNELATDFIRKSFQILDAEDFIDFFGAFEFTKKNSDFIETKQNGGRFAGSTGGSITGKHANVLIADDPISCEMSYSKAERDRANRFITQTLTTRKRDKDNTPIIMIMQRLHDEDPSGYVLSKAKKEGLKIKHICLPSELSSLSTNIDLYSDGLLDPNRMNREILKKIKSELGSFAFAGQFEQSPFPEEGGIIKREWFTKCSSEVVPKYLIWDCWIDSAYTDKTKNDPTGIMFAAFDRSSQKIFIKLFRNAYLTLPDLIKQLPELYTDVGCDHRSRTFIEPKASGLSLEQYLRQTKMNPMLIKTPLVSQGKQARIMSCSPSMQAGKWMLIDGGWHDDFIGQLCSFPNGKHDEAVDLCGYASEFYLGGRKNVASIRIVN